MKGSLLVPRLIWSALFASTLIYIAVLELSSVETEGNWVTLFYPLLFAAASTAGASLLAPRLMLRQRPSTGPTRQTDGRYLTVLVLSLALAESVAIFGLVLGFLGAPPTTVVPFFAVTWILMLLQFPTPEKRNRFNA